MKCIICDKEIDKDKAVCIVKGDIHIYICIECADDIMNEYLDYLKWVW